MTSAIETQPNAIEAFIGSDLAGLFTSEELTALQEKAIKPVVVKVSASDTKYAKNILVDKTAYNNFINSDLAGLFTDNELAVLQEKINKPVEVKVPNPKTIKTNKTPNAVNITDPTPVLKEFFSGTKATFKVTIESNKPVFKLQMLQRDGFDISEMFDIMELKFQKSQNQKKDILYIIRYSDLDKFKEVQAKDFRF